MAIKLPLLPEPVPGRVCWSCTHMYFATADPGYSEFTPGSDFHMSCGKGYWDFDNYDDGLDQFAAKLQTAERCADFTPRSK